MGWWGVIQHPPWPLTNRARDCSTVSTVQESSPDEYYRQASLIETAARWQPPEVLAQSLFTLASDAWSFGVLLYEIWTLGQVPYGDLVREADVVAAILQNGRRLPVLHASLNCPIVFPRCTLGCRKMSHLGDPVGRRCS